MDRHVELVSDALQLMLPHVRPVAVAAPGVGGDEYLARLGVALGANSTPPGLDGRHRKDRRVVVDADADEAFVGGQVIDAVWDRFADRIGRGVVDVFALMCSNCALRSGCWAPSTDLFGACKL
jgi:hypothetical protein